jgi:hypothetical protein
MDERQELERRLEVHGWRSLGWHNGARAWEFRQGSTFGKTQYRHEDTELEAIRALLEEAEERQTDV